MKILLYGSKGWIGGQFRDLLESNNIECVCGTSRVDNDETLLQEITLESLLFFFYIRN